MLHEIRLMQASLQCVEDSVNDSDSGIGLDEAFMQLDQSKSKKEIEIQNIVNLGFNRQIAK